VPWIKEGWYTPEGLSSNRRVHAQIWPSLQECRDFWVSKFLDGKLPDDWDDSTCNWTRKDGDKETIIGIKEFETNKEWTEYMKDFAVEQEKSVQELTKRYLN
jgi:hypothetical protein